MQPLLGANIPAAEIAVADAEALTQRLIKRNFTVQVFHLINEFIQRLVVQAVLVMDETLGIEARFHLKEAEAATKRIIDHGETAVCRVHHADDVEVLRDGEREPVISESRFCASVVLLDQHKQLTEDFTHVATVDFVDDKEELLVRLVGSLLAEAIENTILQLEAILDRLIAHHEVFVRIVLVELYELNAAIVFFTHHGPCQTSCGESLTNTGSTLQDDVLLIAKNGHKVLVAFFGHIHFIEEIALRISVNGSLLHYRILLTNHVKDEVKFASGELEQAALRILEILHTLQLRAPSQGRIINR